MISLLVISSIKSELAVRKPVSGVSVTGFAEQCIPFLTSRISMQSELCCTMFSNKFKKTNTFHFLRKNHETDEILWHIYLIPFLSGVHPRSLVLGKLNWDIVLLFGVVFT